MNAHYQKVVRSTWEQDDELRRDGTIIYGVLLAAHTMDRWMTPVIRRSNYMLLESSVRSIIVLKDRNHMGRPMTDAQVQIKFV